MDTSREVLERLVSARTQVAAASTADRVADVLRGEIAEGWMRAGSRLREQELCDSLGVSRNTVREALSQLVGERLAVREAHRGVFVATPDADTVRDVYRARQVLEPAALRLVKPGADVARELRAAVEEGRRAVVAGDGDGVGNANQHFHRAVVALAGSTRLDHQMALLLAEMRLVFHRVGAPQAFHLPYLEDNDAVCAQLEAGRPAAAADLLADYLDRAADQLLGAFAEQ